jgi:hypothetical protein
MPKKERESEAREIGELKLAALETVQSREEQRRAVEDHDPIEGGLISILSS